MLSRRLSKDYERRVQNIEEIQSAGLAPRMRLKLGTGETFVIDITREPKPRVIRPSGLRSSSP